MRFPMCASRPLASGHRSTSAWWPVAAPSGGCDMAFERLRVDNQVAIVTGAGRGVGRGIALALAEAGARVVCSARSKNEVDATVKAIRSAGVEAIGVLADVLKKADLKALADETCDRYGGVDILVNTAGGQNYKPFLGITER